MIGLRTGIDLIEVARVRKSLENPRFLERVYGPRERLLLNCPEPRRSQRAAANFAAKEAFSKVLGTGLLGFELNQVEILRGSRGEPYLSLRGSAAELAAGLELSVSLTHTSEYAQAVVVSLPCTSAEG